MTGPVQRSIGRTGLVVSALGYGAAPLGNLYRQIDDQTARDALSAAFDAGVNYVDTAPYYGFGLSERRIGEALRGRPDIVVSTKVGRLLEPDVSVRGADERNGFHSPMPFRPVYDYSHDAILRSHDDSLQRMGLAKVGLLFIHDIGVRAHGEAAAFHLESLTVGGGLRALERLRSEGVIAGFGVGVNEVDICHEVMDHAELDVLLLGGRYSLLEQGAMDTLFPRCLETGTSVIVGGPYNSGILATGVRSGGSIHYDYAAPPAEILARVAAMEGVCDLHGIDLPAAALQFTLAHPAVSCVIPGIDSAHRVGQTLTALGAPIGTAFWQDLKGRGLLRRDAPVPGGPR